MQHPERIERIDFLAIRKSLDFIVHLLPESVEDYKNYIAFSSLYSTNEIATA